MLAMLVAAGCSRPPGVEQPRAEYDEASGRLRRLVLDLTHDGRHDTVSVMDGARVERIELDLDDDGRVDRWDFYTDGRALDRVGFSRAADGVMDAQAFYGPQGEVTHIEISTRGDGRFNRVEFYEAGRLARSEMDRNGDGRPDQWETYRPNPMAPREEPPFAVASVAFDDMGTGSPQRRIVYERRGQPRIEMYPGGDVVAEPDTARR